MGSNETKAGTQDARPQVDGLSFKIKQECVFAARRILGEENTPATGNLMTALIRAAKTALGQYDEPQDEYGVGIPVVAHGPAGLNLPTIRDHEDYAKALAQQAIMAGHWMKEAKSWEAEASEATHLYHKAKEEAKRASIDSGDYRKLYEDLKSDVEVGEAIQTIQKLSKDAGTEAGGRKDAPDKYAFRETLRVEMCAFNGSPAWRVVNPAGTHCYNPVTFVWEPADQQGASTHYTRFPSQEIAESVRANCTIAPPETIPDSESVKGCTVAPAKKQTAAEKFDLVPPWCVVKTINDGGRGCAPYVQHVGSVRFGANHRGEWFTDGGEWFADEARARQIARLTRPLDSWEPKDTDPLPVEGWKVERFFDAYVVKVSPDAYFTRHGLVTGNRLATPAQAFQDRRAAYIWAWTEAAAPTVKENLTVRPITEADVKVGQRWRDSDKRCYIRRITDDGYHNESIDVGGTMTKAEIAEAINREGWTLIADGTGATDGPAEDPIAEVQDALDIARASSHRDVSNNLVMPDRAFDQLRRSIARLSAGKVQKPATLHNRSQDASTNELATGIAGADVITDAEGQQWTNGQAPEPQP